MCAMVQFIITLITNLTTCILVTAVQNIAICLYAYVDIRTYINQLINTHDMTGYNSSYGCKSHNISY